MFKFYDINFVKALSNKNNVKDKNGNKIQLNFKELKNDNGNEYYVLENGNLIDKVYSLTINNNNIHYINGIGNFINLSILHLSHNKIKELPNEIYNLINLKLLNLINNNIDSFADDISKLKNLELLAFDYNDIQKLPDNLFKIKLKKLYGEKNKLNNNDIIVLEKLKTLKQLKLKGNLFKNKKEIKKRLSFIEELEI